MNSFDTDTQVYRTTSPSIVFSFKEICDLLSTIDKFSILYNNLNGLWIAKFDGIVSVGTFFNVLGESKSPTEAVVSLFKNLIERYDDIRLYPGGYRLGEPIRCFIWNRREFIGIGEQS